MMTATGEGEDSAEQGEIDVENNNIMPPPSKTEIQVVVAEVDNNENNGVVDESSKEIQLKFSEVLHEICKEEVLDLGLEVCQNVHNDHSCKPESVEVCSEAGFESGSLEIELRRSEKRAHKMCQTTWENPRRQSLLVLNLLRRLSEQEAANERLRLEKDRQLKDISSNLLFFESQLRREQERISRLLEEKDRRIAEQDRHIEALLRLNRRLAAKRCRTKDDEAKKKNKRQQRRISWHNEVYVITDYDKHWTQTNFRESAAAGGKGSGLGEMRRIEDYGNGTERRNGMAEMFQREVEEVCDSVSMVTKESEGDDGNDTVFAFPSVPSSLCRKKDGGSLDKDTGDPSLNVLEVGGEEHGSCSPPPDRIGTPNLGVFYNRVMSNHRSVTKPKDVKYKKISRVKSRSLEELRGRLRVPHPMTCTAYPLLLESNEETTQ